MKNFDTLFVCFVLSAIACLYTGCTLLWNRRISRKAFSVLTDIGRQFGNTPVILCCSINDNPVRMSFKSFLWMDEVLTEIRILAENVGYQFGFISYGSDQAAFFIEDEKTRIRFEISRLSEAGNPEGKTTYHICPK